MATTKGIWICLVIMVIVLTGCNTIEVPENLDRTPTSIIVVDAQATAAVPPATSTPEPSTATSTAAASTLEALPTPPATPISDEPTQAADPTALPVGTGGETISELPAPTGAWVATTTYDSMPFPSEIVFTLRNTETEEAIVVEQLTGTESEPIPYAPFPMAWNQVGETIYYTHYPVYMDGCPRYDGSALYGYSTTTHNGGILNEREGFFFYFSPDATRVAYLPSNPVTEVSTIAVYDTISDTLHEVPLDTAVVADPADEVMANIYWNPARSLAAMHVMVNVCGGVGTTSLVLLDSETMAQTKIDMDTSRSFVFDGWEGDNNQILRLRVDEDAFLKYDVDRGEWIEDS